MVTEHKLKKPAAEGYGTFVCRPWYQRNNKTNLTLPKQLIKKYGILAETTLLHVQDVGDGILIKPVSKPLSFESQEGEQP